METNGFSITKGTNNEKRLPLSPISLLPPQAFSLWLENSHFNEVDISF